MSEKNVNLQALALSNGIAVWHALLVLRKMGFLSAGHYISAEVSSNCTFGRCLLGSNGAERLKVWLLYITWNGVTLGSSTTLLLASITATRQLPTPDAIMSSALKSRKFIFRWPSWP